jgi:hypothetical protein
MGERLQPLQSLAYLHEAMQFLHGGVRGFSVAWGKFTKTRFTIYDFARRNVSEKKIFVGGGDKSAGEMLALIAR